MCIHVFPTIKVCKENKRCIYQISFKDNSYYIGSTNDIRQRLSNYNNSFARSIGSVNKRLAEKFLKFGRYCITILEVVPLGTDLKFIEHQYILRHGKYPEFLNRSRSAFNNSGMVKSR